MTTSSKRRVLISLGAIDPESYSDEFDLSSMTRAFLMMKKSDAENQIVVNFQASPQPFGETPTWHEMYEIRGLSVSQSTATRIQQLLPAVGSYQTLCAYIPLCASNPYSAYGFLDTPAPRRMRLHFPSSTVGVDWAYIEGLRSVS